MKKTFTVTKKDAEARLDVFLTSNFKDRSRSQLQKLIKSGGVVVNGGKKTPHFALSEGDVVTVEDEPSHTSTDVLVPRKDIPLSVVYEDDDVAVINKQFGLLVHPATAHDTETLAHALIAHWPKITTVGDTPDRPGIVHRLDKDASGLLVVAKTKKAFASLKRQFQKHTIKKEYAVLVDGGPSNDEGTVNLHIGRKRNSGRMAARHEPREGDKDAVTHYYVEERYPRVTLLTVRTETGRTHQIRAHMDALGCPVVGDTLYGLKRAARFPAPRLFLHAKTLGFTHPTSRKKLVFSASLPPELEKILKGFLKKRE